MKNKERTLKEREEKMLAAQDLFLRIQKDTRKIKNAIAHVKEAHERIEEMTKYYHGDWIEDSEVLLEESEINFIITDQDSIYDEIFDQYAYVKKLLKQCASYISDDE